MAGEAMDEFSVTLDNDAWGGVELYRVRQGPFQLGICSRRVGAEYWRVEGAYRTGREVRTLEQAVRYLRALEIVERCATDLDATIAALTALREETQHG